MCLFEAGCFGDVFSLDAVGWIIMVCGADKGSEVGISIKHVCSPCMNSINCYITLFPFGFYLCWQEQSDFFFFLES